MASALNTPFTMYLEPRDGALLASLARSCERSGAWVARTLLNRELAARGPFAERGIAQDVEHLLQKALIGLDDTVVAQLADSLPRNGSKTPFAVAMTRDMNRELGAIAQAERRTSAQIAGKMIKDALSALREPRPGSGHIIVDGPVPTTSPRDTGAVEKSSNAGEVDAALLGQGLRSGPGPRQIRASEARPDVIQLVAANLHQAMLRSWGQVNFTRLAKAADVGETTARRAVHGSSAVATDTLAKFAGALGVEPWQLLAPNLGEMASTPYNQEATAIAAALDAIPDPAHRQRIADAAMLILGHLQ